MATASNKQRRLFLTVVALLWLSVGLFAYYQYQRERDYKKQLLTTQLLQLNEELYLYHAEGTAELGRAIALAEKNPRLKSLRATIIDRRGQVIYETDGHPTNNNNVFDKREQNKLACSAERRKRALTKNHLTRPEVRQAIAQGTGICLRRTSRTMGDDYLYAASYFPDKHLVIRTALPYQPALIRTLAVDHSFLWYAVVLLILLTVVFYLEARAFARALDQLTRQKQEALKRQLTLNMSHELKTPVASLQGYIESLIAHPELDDGRRHQFLERCHAQTLRLTALLRDITLLTRIDEAPEQMERTPLDLATLIHTCADDEAPRLAQRFMTLQLDLPPAMPILGHAPSLESIFRNLIANSIAYAGQGTTITITAGSETDQYHITYRDDGPGVPPEHLDRLFERFYRIDKGRSRQMGGTGLGLAIVKNAVLLHKGHIEARLPREGGLEFVFTLVKGDRG